MSKGAEISLVVSDMDEPTWRGYVVARLDQSTEDHAAVLATVRRIERNTRMARNVQDISKATHLLYRIGGGIAKVFLRLLTAAVIVYTLAYMVFNHGQVPAWVLSLLTLIRRDL